MIAFIICFPFIAALALLLLKKSEKLQKYTLFASCAVIIVAVLYFAVSALLAGDDQVYLSDGLAISRVMLGIELGIAALIAYFGIKYKKYWVIALSLAQTGLIVWLEIFAHVEIPGNYIIVDRLSIIMVLIIGIVGSLICVYAAGYMKDYHAHHKEYTDRRAFFFAMLFVFLGAMFGLVLASNLIWLFFFWEVTTLCSFLLIGYTRTEEAIRNSFRALWMNLLGGFGFAIAIVYSFRELGVAELHELVAVGTGTELALIPIILLAFAGLTKSAQLPFSSWLLGAMVAPTPTSALLHSATMVKAGVYLILRLAPALEGNLAGYMVAAIGGFTFLATSMLAISQSDAKKVLAYSTISNLGLIAACAGIGLYEGVWAGILLMIFHAVSKSLLFLSVGAVENSTGSRNIEDMHGLIVKLPLLAFVMIIGIAGMFLAPFGMLISKWAALKAFVISGNVLLLLFLVYGSATTLFYWTKWLGALVSVVNHSKRKPNTVTGGEWLSLISHAVLMIALCLTFPLASTYLIEPFLTGMFSVTQPGVISSGNVIIMALMLGMIVVLPIAVRLLTFNKDNRTVVSYMGGVNAGDDRRFTNSFGETNPMYLSNWYMDGYFGEHKLLKLSIGLAAAAVAIMMIITIGGSI